MAYFLLLSILQHSYKNMHADGDLKCVGPQRPCGPEYLYNLDANSLTHTLGLNQEIMLNIKGAASSNL